MSDSRYQQVLFDFDGVLCDSIDAAAKAYQHIRATEFPILPTLDHKLTLRDIYVGRLADALLRWLSAEQSKQFFHRHTEAMLAAASELTLFAGAADLMARLHPDRVAIVTSSYEAVARRVFSQAGADSANGLRIVARDAGLSKARGIEHILNERGVPPEQALYVGDLESDIHHCRALPIDCAIVTYGYNRRSQLEGKGATYLVDSIDALAALLDSKAVSCLRSDGTARKATAAAAAVR